MSASRHSLPRFKESSLDASTFSAAKTHFFQNDSRPSPTYRNSFSLRGVEKTLLNAFLADSGVTSEKPYVLA